MLTRRPRRSRFNPQVDLYNGAPLDTRVDVWALGCLAYGLATFKHPFQDAGPLGILSAKFKALPPTTPAPVATIVRACLQVRGARRGKR